jgi:hypothetical protein
MRTRVAFSIGLILSLALVLILSFSFRFEVFGDLQRVHYWAFLHRGALTLIYYSGRSTGYSSEFSIQWEPSDFRHECNLFVFPKGEGIYCFAGAQYTNILYYYASLPVYLPGLIAILIWLIVKSKKRTGRGFPVVGRLFRTF